MVGAVHDVDDAKRGHPAEDRDRDPDVAGDMQVYAKARAGLVHVAQSTTFPYRSQ